MRWMRTLPADIAERFRVESVDLDPEHMVFRADFAPIMPGPLFLIYPRVCTVRCV
jgi:hypothetical protein